MKISLSRKPKLQIFGVRCRLPIDAVTAAAAGAGSRFLALLTAPADGGRAYLPPRLPATTT